MSHAVEPDDAPAWERVRRLALALPEAVETTPRHFDVRGKGFAWERPLRRSDLVALGDAAPSGPILGVRVEHLEAKEALLASEGDACFSTPHFDGYAAVLVRLDVVEDDTLAELLAESWLTRAPKRVARAYLEDAESG